MLVVVNLHRLRVNERFQRLVSVGQWRQRERIAWRGCGGSCLCHHVRQGGQCRAGENGGFNGLASVLHKLGNLVFALVFGTLTPTPVTLQGRN